VTDGGTGRAECEQMNLNGWCGVSDVIMHFVQSQGSCWFILPSGCPKHSKLDASKWIRDEWGEARGLSQNARGCNARGNTYNTWCGTSDTLMLFVTQPAPTEPGCWYFQPNGCQKHGLGARVWRRDTVGERNKNTGKDETACKLRSSNFNWWCGGSSQTGGTIMHFVSQTPGLMGKSIADAPGERMVDVKRIVRKRQNQIFESDAHGEIARPHQKESSTNGLLGVESH